MSKLKNHSFTLFVVLFMFLMSSVALASPILNRASLGDLVTNGSIIHMNDPATVLNDTLGAANKVMTVQLEMPVTRYMYNKTHVYVNNNGCIEAVASSDAHFTNANLHTGDFVNRLPRILGAESRYIDKGNGTNMFIYNTDAGTKISVCTDGNKITLIQEDVWAPVIVPFKSI